VRNRALFVHQWKVYRAATWEGGCSFVNARTANDSGDPHDDRRPTVLLVDDHPAVVTAVQSVLEPSFHVVGAVTDGDLAINAARRLDPDIVVLDVAMPGIGGIQTLRELKRLGSRAAVVFLTMHGAEEFILAAVESGALGYVLKSRIVPDLPNTLNQALARRLSVPSLTSLVAAAGRGREHAVHFHANDRHHHDELCRSIAKALQHGDPVAVVTAAATRDGVAERLTSVGLDIEKLTKQGMYRAFDVADAVDRVMQDGQIDRDRLAGLVGTLEQTRLAVAPDPLARMTIFGEMAVPLLESGQGEAAMSLERLWDALTASERFLTVCMYPVDCFSDDPGGGRLQRLYAEHSAVTHHAHI
jgi:DNA-binding NarL/FixJ family response regulator